MKTATYFFKYRSLIGLASAGAALLCASGASAQTASPYYSFKIVNKTATSVFDPAFPVYDPVNFNSLQINETFADGFLQTISLAAPLQQGDTTQTGAQFFTPTGGGTVSDPVHTGLTSAVLTGTFSFPGIPADGTGTLPLTIQPTADPNSQYPLTVLTSFSASLFGPVPTGINVGTFSLVDANSGIVDTVNIEAAAAPVPEASTTLSLGLLLALGLGSLMIARRKQSVPPAC